MPCIQGSIRSLGSPRFACQATLAPSYKRGPRFTSVNTFSLFTYIYSDSKSRHHIGCDSSRGDLGAVRGKAGHSVRSAVSCALDRLLTYSYIQYLILPSTISTLPPPSHPSRFLHRSSYYTTPFHHSVPRPIIPRITPTHRGKASHLPPPPTNFILSSHLIHPIAPPFFFVGDVD